MLARFHRDLHRIWNLGLQSRINNELSDRGLAVTCPLFDAPRALLLESPTAVLASRIAAAHLQNLCLRERQAE